MEENTTSFGVNYLVRPLGGDKESKKEKGFAIVHAAVVRVPNWTKTGSVNLHLQEL